MKKMISICLLICLCFTSVAFAAEAPSIEEGFHTTKTITSDIYITYVDADLIDEMDVESIDYKAVYEKESYQNFNALPEKKSIYVKKLETADIDILIDDPILNTAIKRIAEAEATGLIVNSINIIIPQNSDEMSVFSDADYWRNNTYYWGVYLGQEIRYFFNTLSVGTGLVEANNIPSRWSNILPAAVKIVVDRLIGTTKFDTVYGIINDIGTVLGAATPVNINFDSTREYVKGESKGTLTFKEIVVQDINNKINGHAFYPWGFVQHLSYQDRIEVKYYEGIKNGAPSYPVKTTPYSSAKVVTSPYYNNTGVLFPRIRQYYNYVGYQTYHEYVELKMSPTF